MDDLFLDIVLLLSGEVFQKDDELEEAFLNGIIDKSLCFEGGLRWNF